MLKLTHKILIGGLLLLTSCGQATGSEKKDAIAALQALNAKTDTGITFPSYVDELGKAKIVVEKYKVDRKQKQSGRSKSRNSLGCTYFSCKPLGLFDSKQNRRFSKAMSDSGTEGNQESAPIH
jgi:hypothetical protein